MKFKKSVFIIFFIALVACAPKNNSVSSTNINNIISGDYVNKTIIVSAPDGWNTYKLGNAILLAVFPGSTHTVILNDHNVVIYKNNTGKWIPIENQNPLPAITGIIKPNKIPAESTVQILAMPNLAQISGTVLLRIVVTANIYDNKTLGKQVSAYVDVTLHP